MARGLEILASSEAEFSHHTGTGRQGEGRRERRGSEREEDQPRLGKRPPTRRPTSNTCRSVCLRQATPSCPPRPSPHQRRLCSINRHTTPPQPPHRRPNRTRPAIPAARVLHGWRDSKTGKLRWRCAAGKQFRTMPSLTLVLGGSSSNEHLFSEVLKDLLATHDEAPHRNNRRLPPCQLRIPNH